MSALPGQTEESYEQTLQKVLLLEPEHIPAYSLIIEEGTPFYEKYSSGLGLPDEDAERMMYQRTKELLERKGYYRYEISNYAKSGMNAGIILLLGRNRLYRFWFGSLFDGKSYSVS